MTTIRRTALSTIAAIKAATVNVKHHNSEGTLVPSTLDAAFTAYDAEPAARLVSIGDDHYSIKLPDGTWYVLIPEVKPVVPVPAARDPFADFKAAGDPFADLTC